MGLSEVSRHTLRCTPFRDNPDDTHRKLSLYSFDALQHINISLLFVLFFFFCLSGLNKNNPQYFKANKIQSTHLSIYLPHPSTYPPIQSSSRISSTGMLCQIYKLNFLHVLFFFMNLVNIEPDTVGAHVVITKF